MLKAKKQAKTQPAKQPKIKPQVTTKAAAPTPEPMPNRVEASERVMFEGQHVSGILQDNKEMRDEQGKITHYHCMLENGTTAHVPVTLFV